MGSAIQPEDEDMKIGIVGVRRDQPFLEVVAEGKPRFDGDGVIKSAAGQALSPLCGMLISEFPIRIC
jgi:hypothetical protein